MSALLPLPPPPDPLRKRGRTRLVIWIILAVLASIVILLNLGKGAYQAYYLASDATDHFHRQLDAADYDGIYADASHEFRRAATRAESVKFLETVHHKMGESGKRSTAGFHVNWRNGRWWIDAAYNTQFTLGQGQESFIWVMEQDRLRLYGYHIDSPNLH